MTSYRSIKIPFSHIDTHEEPHTQNIIITYNIKDIFIEFTYSAHRLIVLIGKQSSLSLEVLFYIQNWILVIY